MFLGVSITRGPWLSLYPVENSALLAKKLVHAPRMKRSVAGVGGWIFTGKTLQPGFW